MDFYKILHIGSREAEKGEKKEKKKIKKQTTKNIASTKKMSIPDTELGRLNLG